MEAAELLEHVRRQPRGRTTFKNLIRQLGIRGPGRTELRETLSRLVSSGRLIEPSRQHYVLPAGDGEWVTGRISLHRRGFGFVTPDRAVPGTEGDIYIRRKYTGEAMQDDRVVVRIQRVWPDGRAEGRIEQILHRTQAYIVGRFECSPKGGRVIPHDDRVREHILIPRGQELPPERPSPERLGAVKPVEVKSPQELDGLIVYVELTQFPTQKQHARGRVIEVLGRPDDFGVDVEITIRSFHIPHVFPSAVREEVEEIPDRPPEEEMQRRRDFRGLDIVTIDGEDARDFDDAVWAERLDNGNYALQVHIADVSYYVRPDTALDEEAFRRGNSVYFPDRAVPMLPAELSTGICSLNPDEDRLVQSVLLEITPKGETVGVEFADGVIRSAARMTYTDVAALLDGDAAVRARYEGLLERFERMKELALILNRRREKQGAIDFDLPEPVILFDPDGVMSGVTRSERNTAHRIIEEFMLAANEAVAGYLAERAEGSLYRIHEPPGPKKVLEFKQIAEGFGHSLGVDVPVRRISQTRRRRDGSKSREDYFAVDGDIDITPRHYQRLIDAITGKPEERILSYLMLRSLKQARYSEENSGHFALAKDVYTHFTSPIRRYPDLIIHRLLRAARDAAARSEADPAPAVPGVELAEIARHTSFTERRAADAERSLINWKKARFMEERLGEEFEALVTGASPYGLNVELMELFVEGQVPAQSLEDEGLYFREKQRGYLKKKAGLSIQIGDRIRVRADRVDFSSMRTEFSWVPQDDPRPPWKRTRKKRRRAAAD